MGTKTEKPAAPMIDRTKMLATTQADIRRHAAEDGSELAADLSTFVKRRPGQRGLGKRPAKPLVSLRLDPETLDASQASGDGWRSRMGELLKREAPKRRAVS